MLLLMPALSDPVTPASTTRGRKFIIDTLRLLPAAEKRELDWWLVEIERALRARW
jgi:hypothetical protein